ncbi:uncharacterized protein LOC131993920 isoform X2 [Centropristis striata]|nr:uncharacterized protein LOC131993920 isoform X2 [Centropristis striata]
MMGSASSDLKSDHLDVSADISQNTVTVSTQECCDSTAEKSPSGMVDTVIKNVKSVFKLFGGPKRKSTEQNVEDTVESETSDSKSGSPTASVDFSADIKPENITTDAYNIDQERLTRIDSPNCESPVKTSPTVSAGSRDVLVAEEAELTSVSQKLMDVAVEDLQPEIVSKELMKDSLCTDMGETPGRSQVLQGEEHVDEDENVSQKTVTVSTQECFDSTAEKSSGKMVSTVIKNVKSVFKLFGGPNKKSTEQNVENTVESETSDSKSGSPTASVDFNEDIKPAEEEVQTSVPLEKADCWSNQNVTPEAKKVDQERLTRIESPNCESPVKTSPTVSAGSMDVLVAEEDELTSVSQKLMDVAVEDLQPEIVSKELMKDSLCTDMGETPGRSQVLQGEEHVDEDEHVSQKTVTVSTQECFDSTAEKSSGKMVSTVIKNVKSVFNLFGGPNKKSTEQNVENTVESETSDSKSGSPTASVDFNEDIKPAEEEVQTSVPLEKADCWSNQNVTPEAKKVDQERLTRIESPNSESPEKTSPTVSTGSMDVLVAEEDELTSVSQKLMDVAVEDLQPEIVSKELMKDSLCTDMRETPGPSQVLQGEEHVDEDENVSQKTVTVNTQECFDSTAEKSSGKMVSTVIKNVKSVFKLFGGPKKKSTEQNVEDTVESESSYSKSGCPTVSVDFSEDIKPAEAADHTWKNENVTTEAENVDQERLTRIDSPNCESPQKTSPTVSAGSRDFLAAEEAELTSAPLKVMDLAVDNLQSDMGETSGPSMVLPGEVHVDGDIRSASRDSVSKHLDVSTDIDDEKVSQSTVTVSTQECCDSNVEESSGTMVNTVIKNVKSVFKLFGGPKKKSTEQNVEEAVESETSDSKSGSPTASVDFSEDIKAAEEEVQTSVPLEKADYWSNENVTPEAKQVDQERLTRIESPNCESPEKMSPTVSAGSRDFLAAEEAELTSVSLKVMDLPPVNVSEELMDDSLCTDMGETPGPAQMLQGEVHVDEDVRSTSRDSTSKHLDVSPDIDDDNLSQNTVTVSTQECCDSTAEKSSSGMVNTVIKNVKSVFKLFGGPKRKSTEQNVEEGVDSESSDSKSGSPTASVDFSEDIKPAEEPDQTSVPLEITDSWNDENVTTETDNIDQERLTRIESSNCASPKQTSPTVSAGSRGSHVEEDVRSASRDSASKNAYRAKSGPPFQAEMTSVEMDFRSKPTETVGPAPEKDLDVESENGDSESEGPHQASPTASVGSSKDISPAEEAVLPFVPLEMTDNVKYEDVQPETEELYQDCLHVLPSTDSAEHPVSSVTEEDLESTPGPSGQTGHPEGLQQDHIEAALAQHLGLRNILISIITKFFDSLPNEWDEISKGVFNSEVQEELVNISVQFLRMVIEVITDILSAAMNDLPPQPDTSARSSPFSGQACGVFGQRRLSELLGDNFVITDDHLQLCLKNDFVEAFREIVCADLPVNITPQFTGIVARALTKEVDSVLSETIKASQSDRSSKVHSTCFKSSCCRACRKVFVAQTLKSLLTQFKTFMTPKHLGCERKDVKSTEETKKEQRKKSPWWSCFSQLKKRNVDVVSRECPGNTDRLSSSSKLPSGHKQDSLCTDMDETPGPSVVLSGAEHVDEDVRTGNRDSTFKKTYQAKSGSPFLGEVTSIEMENVEPAPEQDSDVESESGDSESDSLCSEVDSVLSETIEASLSDGSSRVHCFMSSCCRACRKVFVAQTLKSRLTQFKTFMTPKHLGCERKDVKSTEDTKKEQRKKSPWWSCFSQLKKRNLDVVSRECPGNTERLSSSGKLSSGHKQDSLCSDMDETPGPSVVLSGAEHVDEDVRTGSRDSTVKNTYQANSGSPFLGEVTSVEMENVEPAPEQDSAVESESGDSESDSLRSEVDSVLSETIEASLSDGSSRVHCFMSSCCGACRKVLQRVKSLFTQFKTKLTAVHTKIKRTKGSVNPVSCERMDNPDGLSSGHKLPSCSPDKSIHSGSSSEWRSTPLVLVDYEEEDNNDTAEDRGNTPP